MEDWRPMETAPKDGTHILVDDKEEGVMWVSWDKEVYHYPGSRGTYCWCVPHSHQDEQGGCMVAYNPTGWMPMPKSKNI